MEQADWERRYATTELIWTASPNRFVVAELTGMAPGRALDLATGEGRNAVWLAQQGWDVTAVDFATVGLAKARRLSEYHRVQVNWVAADLRDYVPESATYDLVLIAYLHIPPDEWHAVLRRGADALTPGGTLLVVGHDLTNIAEGVGGPQDPDVLHTPEDITADLGDLKVVRAERVRREVDTPEGPRYAIDTVVRAIRDTPTR